MLPVMAVVFEWDPQKARANAAKQGVTFLEAAAIFGDPLSSTIQDPAHSLVDDERLVTIGALPNGRILVVAHADRHGRIRIISARPATRRERNAYGEGCNEIF